MNSESRYSKLTDNKYLTSRYLTVLYNCAYAMTTTSRSKYIPPYFQRVRYLRISDI